MANESGVDLQKMSLPVRGAWVEIPSRRGWKPSGIMSLPVRGAWVEMYC